MEIKSTQARRQYKFGLFETDLDQGTLSRESNTREAARAALPHFGSAVGGRGDVLTREDLRKNLRPDGTFLEFDGSLNTALMELLAPLNDNAENPVFIETVRQ
jgi:hypothetical protein